MRLLSQLLAVGLLLSLAYASFQLHTRLRLTFLGYEVGRLKLREADLLKMRSVLQMEYTRLTQKESLLELLKAPSGSKPLKPFEAQQ